MAKNKDKQKKKQKDREPPIVSMNEKEREELWDDLYFNEEGIILEFDPDSNIGIVKSLKDGSVYKIDGRELLRTKIELRPGDKVLFAPFENINGDNFVRIIRIIELKV